MLRIKQNTKIISNVAYHGELEKKAQMERQREITETFDAKGWFNIMHMYYIILL